MAMSRLEVIPSYLMKPELVDELIAYLVALPGRGIDKKELLCEWCRVTGVSLTAALVERVYPGERKFVSG